MKADGFLRKEQKHPNRDAAVLQNVHFSFQYAVCWSAGKILENETLQTPCSLPELFSSAVSCPGKHPKNRLQCSDLKL